MAKQFRRIPNHEVHEFGSTCWSLVLAVVHGPSAESKSALESLCRLYWYPLYAYVRQRGFGPTEAQDLTQEFFAHLIEKRVVEAADRDRGKFRSYLLTSLRNFLANQWDKQQAAKRGGARKIIPLDFASGESRFSREPSHELTPERLYQKEWAITLLDTVMEQLREEYVASGKEQQFDRLKPFLAGKNASSRYADAANSLGVSEAAAMTAASRLRRRYRELLHARIADTISDSTEIEEEMGALFEILAS